MKFDYRYCDLDAGFYLIPTIVIESIFKRVHIIWFNFDLYLEWK